LFVDSESFAESDAVAKIIGLFCVVSSTGVHRLILDHRGAVGNSLVGALAHVGLARARALRGDEDGAKSAYQDFLTLWKDADPDIPILKQAKAEYAKLQ
jgi:hypothetical protein